MEKIPRAEHPRPSFRREEWLSLNGEWEFYNDLGASGEEREVYLHSLPDKILVPFCPESELSGVGFRDFMPSVWYARDIDLSETMLRGDVLLHIGACDYRTTVYCNGEKVGSHAGGYTSFCFSLRQVVKKGKNRIVIHAEDDLRSRRQPSGKQSRFYASCGCVYTRTTGIWQSVWLEFPPCDRLRSVRVNATDLGGNVFFEASLEHYLKDAVLQAEISFGGKRIFTAVHPLDGTVNGFNVRLPEVHLWNAGEPNLYDVEYTLFAGGKEIDCVRSYFGIRRVDIDGFRILLNGKSVFQRLILDQGFYPDGVCTAPTDEALRRDIVLAMELGFNGARLHEKVFEERYLYHADRLGYLVWAEFPNWGLDHTRESALHILLPEWMECMEQCASHPSVIGWCPYNETFDIDSRRQIESNVGIVYAATKAIDRTRPVIDTSGYMHTAKTDVYDVHDYEQDPKIFSERYKKHANGEFYNNRCDRQTYRGDVPYIVSEFGGIKWGTRGELPSWGYGDSPRTEEEFLKRYEALSGALLGAGNIAGSCYTQLTDVEQEQNGLYAFDRSRKFKDETYAAIRAANLRPASIEK